MKKGRRSEEDLRKDLDKLEKYLAKPKTMGQIKERFDIGAGTARRWMKGISAVQAEGKPFRYQISA